MLVSLRSSLLLGASLALFASACANDYGGYAFADVDAGADGSAGAGGVAGAAGASGAAGSAAGAAGTGGTCSGGETSCAGSCVSLVDDPNHCGACGKVCAGDLCSDGACQCTSDGHCGDAPSGINCMGDGRCECDGDSCRPGEVCDVGGTNPICACNAGAACGGGETCCPSGCTDLDVDEQNCGACGTVCASGETCSGGNCQ